MSYDNDGRRKPRIPTTARTMKGNLIRFAEMNLMFLKASYFHFEQADNTKMLENMMIQREPEWPKFEVLDGARR